MTISFIRLQDAAFVKNAKALFYTAVATNLRFDADQSIECIRLGASHENAVVRDLFERFISVQQRTQRLGAVVDVAAILSMQGNADRGRILFMEAEGVQCRNCHVSKASASSFTFSSASSPVSARITS